jgi:hypothetical protein
MSSSIEYVFSILSSLIATIVGSCSSRKDNHRTQKYINSVDLLDSLTVVYNRIKDRHEPLFCIHDNKDQYGYVLFDIIRNLFTEETKIGFIDIDNICKVMSYLEQYMYMVTDDNIISLIVKFAGNYCPHNIGILDKKEYVLDCIIGKRVGIVHKIWEPIPYTVKYKTFCFNTFNYIIKECIEKKYGIIIHCVESLDIYFYKKANGNMYMNVKDRLSKTRRDELYDKYIKPRNENWKARKSIPILRGAICIKANKKSKMKQHVAQTVFFNLRFCKHIATFLDYTH